MLALGACRLLARGAGSAMYYLELYGIGALVIFGLMTALWIASLLLRDSSIMDIFWGPGFVVANWVYFALTTNGFPARKGLVSLLVTIWGLRLGAYILWRNWGKGEDFRYRRWREEAGRKWWWQSLFKVFLLQGLLMWIISAPLLAAQISPVPARLTTLDFVAVAVWAIGLFFEAVGDWQLARFKADPANKGRVLSSGVWRYTRHPNYFGDATQWWAYYLVAAASGGFWTIFSPAAMTVLLLRVSGVTLLEKSLKETKPGYREYVESTCAFIPWFPRRRRPRRPPSEGQG
jgi:steroid 5-alpha reductase family enzyme